MAAECLRASTAALVPCSSPERTSVQACRHSAFASLRLGPLRQHELQLSSTASSSFTGLALRSINRSASGMKRGAQAAGPVGVRAAAENKNVLILNTNSGGHAVIGFWLAKQLRTWPRGHSVTIMTVGKEDDSKMKKPPFSRFDELRMEGVRTVWGDPADMAATLGNAAFDVVLDNNGKDLETCKPVIDWARSRGTKQFLFISSAGIYKNSEEPPLVEGDPVKGDAGHVLVEEYLGKVFSWGGWASFRPQYITGSANNKDCEEWFFDRIVRKRPIPIPGSGMQMTVIAPVYDMASMLVAAVENPRAASGAIFNCVGDRAVTFDGLARMCARAAGQEVELVHYDPAAVGVDAKKAFPFRNQHFYSEPRAAKVKLGWRPNHDLQDVLNSRFQDYLASGRDKTHISFDLDEKILRSLKVPVRSF